MKTAPKGYTEEHKKFLEELRDSGVTNMYGAGSYLSEEFDLTDKEAGEYLIFWMKSFDD